MKKIKIPWKHILPVVSCVGVIATAICASRSGAKAQKVLEENNYVHHPNKCKDVVEEAKLVWKEYILTTAVMAVTIGSIIATRKVTKREAAALTMLAGASSKLLRDYKEAIKEVAPDKYEEIVRTIDKKRKDVQIANPPEIVTSGICTSSITPPHPGDDEVLFYDDFFDVHFRSSLADVYAAQYFLNRNFALGMDVTMADFYGFLGIDPPLEMPSYYDSNYDGRTFAEIGWGEGFKDSGYLWIDFDTVYCQPDDGGEPYYLLDYQYPPEYLYPF